MRLLLIGMDRTVFSKGSATHGRIARLGSNLEALDVIIFSTRAHGISASMELAPGARVHPTNSASRLFYGLDALRIAARLKRPDVVSTQDAFEIGLAGLVYSFLFKVPLVVEIHTDFLARAFARHSLINRMRVFIARFVLMGAMSAYTVSHRIREEIIRTWRADLSIEVIPIYVNTHAYASIERKRHKRFRKTLLWVGRFEHEKNPVQAVEALAHVRKAGHDVGLVMVGDGRLRETVRRRAWELKVLEWVDFAGYQADVRPYYAYADLLLVTSAYEGYGMVIVEALAARVPVLAPDVGIVREAGARIAEGDYARSLLTWLADPQSEGSLALHSYKDAEEYYHKLINYYKGVACLRRVRRLLIVTQAVDLDEPVLGFFHAWIAALSAQYEAVEVICLAEGRHALPSNVRVHSLGKESGRSRVKYVVRFFAYVWSLRCRYDSVLVHMNQEYLLLGGLLWRLLGKRAYLWRNYHHGTLLTRIAVYLATGVFCTSQSSYTARFKKTKLMPIGVDTGRFESAAHNPVPGTILSLGRMTPDKRLELIVSALYELRKEGVAFNATMVGAPKEESAYVASIAHLIGKYELAESVSIRPSIPNYETPKLYAEHELFVNTSPSGMYDKTLIEAAAAGCLVLTSIRDFKDAAGEEFWFDGTVTGLASGIRRLLLASEEQKYMWRKKLTKAADSHSLKQLVGRLVTEIQ